MGERRRGEQEDRGGVGAVARAEGEGGDLPPLQRDGRERDEQRHQRGADQATAVSAAHAANADPQDDGGQDREGEDGPERPVRRPGERRPALEQVVIAEGLLIGGPAVVDVERPQVAVADDERHRPGEVRDDEEDQTEAIAPGDDGDRLAGGGRQEGCAHEGAPTFSSYFSSSVLGASGSGTP